IWPVYGGQNGPKSIVSVAPKAELWTPLGLFGQSQKVNSRKFAPGIGIWHHVPSSPMKDRSDEQACSARRWFPIMRVLPGFLIVALATVVAVGGLVLVQRLISTERRKQHNDVAGFIYAVLGVSYAVLLGLMLIAVWEQWNAAGVMARPRSRPGRGGQRAGRDLLVRPRPTPTRGAPHPGARPLLR